MEVERLKIDELLELQPGLTQNDNIIEGSIAVKQYKCDFYLDKKYCIKILLNYDSPFLSKVYETSGTINSNYEHLYSDGMLCLATEIDLKLSEQKDCSLVSLFVNFIQPYFFTYEFYDRFGYYPYGEREHGLLGIIDSYCDITGIKDRRKVCELIANIKKGNYHYRGHLPCPCGSKKKARNCHPNIIKLFQSESILHQIKRDYFAIREELSEHQKTSK